MFNTLIRLGLTNKEAALFNLYIDKMSLTDLNDDEYEARGLQDLVQQISDYGKN